MRKTSEKSLEINVLRHLVNWLEKRTGNKITVLSPTQNLEEHLGYDEILQGLPRGWVMALQFKKPTQETAFMKFTINIPQMSTMTRLFPENCAFYVLPPYPTHLELINDYDQLLDNSLAVDVNHVSSFVTHNTSASEIRFFPNNDKSISDNGAFQNLTNLFPLAEFCQKFPKKIGINVDDFKKIVKKYNSYFEEMKKQGLEIHFLNMMEKQK